MSAYYGQNDRPPSFSFEKETPYMIQERTANIILGYREQSDHHLVLGIKDHGIEDKGRMNRNAREALERLSNTLAPPRNGEDHFDRAREAYDSK